MHCKSPRISRLLHCIAKMDLTDINQISQQDNSKLHLLAILCELFIGEADRMWRRFAAMLSINGGLVALLTLTFQGLPPMFSLIICVFGIVVTFVWLNISILSRYYERRWIADIKHLISSDSMLQEYMHGWETSHPRVKRPIQWSSTTLSIILVLSMAMIWIAFGSLSIWNGIEHGFLTASPNITK